MLCISGGALLYSRLISTSTVLSVQQHHSTAAAAAVGAAQLAVLEMVGAGRERGAVQTRMAQALGIEYRNFFYVLKASYLCHL